MNHSLLRGLYSAAAMREMDAAAIEGLGIPGGHLMERAGVGVAEEILDRYDPASVIVYCGKGNNGGDGFVIARELANAGCAVTVFAVAGRDAYAGDAALNLAILERLPVDIRDGLPDEDDPCRLADVVVDAVFGTGFSGVPHGPAEDALEQMADAASPVVAVDIASGVDGSTGEVGGPAVEADLTVTFQEAKVGHFVTPGGALSGEVVVAPIGIPPSCRRDADVWLLTVDGLTALVRPKGALDHKRSVGTALIVGGGPGMSGAAFMTAMAALRAGAGLVHCAVPAAAASEKPFAEVITVALPDDVELGPASLEAIDGQLSTLKALAVGPGLGRAPQTVEAIVALLERETPMVVDADALWALGDGPERLQGRCAPTVLTPHEGELGRLLGRPAADVAAHRLAAAREGAARSGATVLLKGEASIVADPSGPAYIIPTGNPGLATPGTGDVLTGAVVAQLAKGLGATEAACLGGYLHGLAADLAADMAVGTDGMIAGDLFDFLPTALEVVKQTDRPGAGEEEATDGSTRR